MKQPRLSRLNIWKKHEQRVLEVFLEALLILQKNANLDKSEVFLNRELFFCLLEANRKLRELGGGFEYPPTAEAKNAPSPDDEIRTQREDKIPDFAWGFIDHTEINPKRSARYFIIECKRLGKKPRSDWIINENYINHGVLRFLKEDYGYAKDEISGAMVGYIQSMDFDEILCEVNNAASPQAVPPLSASYEGWQKQGISRLSHVLVRQFGGSPFLLQHFWIDLRDKYITS